MIQQTDRPLENCISSYTLYAEDKINVPNDATFANDKIMTMYSVKINLRLCANYMYHL